MSKNYYDILGIDKNASDSDIRKAFKKLTIKWHPDKWANKSEKEQKEAEEKFKEINEAYQVLSDPQKKSNYDQFGDINGPQGFDAGGFGFNPFDIFRNMRGGGGFGFNDYPRGPEPGKTLQYNLSLTIEEIFNGCAKTINCKRKLRCKTCNGEGGTGVKVCSHCNGTGMITETKRNGFTIMQSSHPCQYCGGTGKTVEHVCRDCHGSGFKEITETLKVNVPPGKLEGTTLNFPNMGWESKHKNGENGDLHIIITYNIDKSKYQIINNDVYELIEVPYFDCILGKTFKHKLPSGKEVEVVIPEYCQDGKQITLYGYGLNRGKYICLVKIKMPKHISNKERDLLKQIQKENGGN